MHVLLALALRNTQAVRDAAAAKLGVLRVSVRKGCCAPWTPARRSGCSWPILWRFSARETSWVWAWRLRCWRRWRSSGASPSHVCCAKEPSPIPLSASCSSTTLHPLDGLRESRSPSGCFCWYGRVFCSWRFPRPQSFPRGCAACSPLWVAWACPYATSRRRFPSLCGSCRCFPRS